jgi:PAS domain S-box-containing protein
MTAGAPADASRIRVLHLEDSALDADLICEILSAAGMSCDIDRVWTREAFEAALRKRSYDLILADHALPTFDGESALTIARALVETPFIFVSGTLGEDVAVEALKRGATDYVVKQRLDRLPRVATRAMSEAIERTERLRAEKALAESELNFSTLVDAMPQLCWMANADGYITWYNQRWHDYTGTTAEEMEGWGWQAVHDPEMLPHVVESWTRSIETGEPFEMTFPLRGADGTFRPFLTRAQPVRDADGRLLRWIGTNTDISPQREAEEALRRLNEELEQRVVEAVSAREEMLKQFADLQKLETIGQLTGGVAHDFNNLLTPILGNLDLIRMRLQGDERSQRLIGNALRSAERARTLVQRLLAFARRQVLESRAVDVPELVSGMTDLLSRSIGPQIAIQVEAEGGLPPARVDPNQLELAILNLAVNARDAMPGGGTLRIRVDAAGVGPDDRLNMRHGRYVRVSVIDSGTGMDAVTLRHAIEPFYSTKGVGKGTGLGLSMVHGLAGQSGGALRLASAPGEGTTAEIWLPIADDPADRIGSVNEEPVPTRPLAILLVDDEELVRTGTAEMLAELGHHVIQAGSGAAALLQLEECSSLDLVITDYLMPGMTGAELAAEIQKRRPSLAILLATGYATLAGDQMASLPLLPKPFRQHELAARIAALTSGGDRRRRSHLRAVN